MIRFAPVLAVALCAAAGTASADAPALQARVLVLPTEGDAPPSLARLGADIADALARGAAKTTGNVARAETSLSDTAVVVGCDPAQRACLDAVAAALNVDQIVFAKTAASGKDATITITAVTRETEPQTRTFTIHAASRAPDLAALEPAVVEMLESGEARRAQAAQHETTTTTTPLPPPPPKQTTETSRPLWPAAITFGGGALVIAGLTSWAVASSKQGDIDGAPTATAADLDRLASLESSARTWATAGNVMVIGGAAIAATGAYLWWRSSRGDHGVAIAPALRPDGAALVIGGAW